MISVRTVIFDYGGVLCRLPGDEPIQSLALRCGLSVEEFLKHFWHFRLQYDRGDLSGQEYWRSIGRAGGKDYAAAEIESFIEADLRLWLEFDGRMILWNRMLRTMGYRTAVISNMPDMLGEHLKARTQLFSEFDNVTLSYEERSAKPEAKIYRTCLAKLGIKAGDAVFLDDKTPNIHAAQSVGLHAILFAGPEKFAGREGTYGLPPIPVA